MDAVEYFRNFIQLQRNLVSKLIVTLKDSEGAEAKRHEIQGQILAYNKVLREIDNYQEMVGL